MLKIVSPCLTAVPPSGASGLCPKVEFAPNQKSVSNSWHILAEVQGHWSTWIHLVHMVHMAHIPSSLIGLSKMGPDCLKRNIQNMACSAETDLDLRSHLGLKSFANHLPEIELEWRVWWVWMAPPASKLHAKAACQFYLNQNKSLQKQHSMVYSICLFVLRYRTMMDPPVPTASRRAIALLLELKPDKQKWLCARTDLRQKQPLKSLKWEEQRSVASWHCRPCCSPRLMLRTLWP